MLQFIIVVSIETNIWPSYALTTDNSVIEKTPKELWTANSGGQSNTPDSLSVATYSSKEK